MRNEKVGRVVSWESGWESDWVTGRGGEAIELVVLIDQRLYSS